MLINEILDLAALDALLEGVLDMPENADLTGQLEILMHRLETAKKALGITNRITNPAERKKHRSRVMVFINQLRAMFNRVADQLESEMAQDDDSTQQELEPLKLAA